MLIRLLSILVATAPHAFADIRFTSPAANALVPLGAISVKWVDSGVAPSVSDLAGYQLFLMAGGNDDSKSVSHTV